MHLTLIQPKQSNYPILNLPSHLSTSLPDSTHHLYWKIQRETKLNRHRFRLFTTTEHGSKPLPFLSGTTINEMGLSDGSTIVVHDLGPQIKSRLAISLQLLGAMIIHGIIYFLAPFFSPITTSPPPTLRSNLLPFSFTTFYFLKRLLQLGLLPRSTISTTTTIPANEFWKGIFLHWGAGGVNVAYWVYMRSSPPSLRSHTLAVDGGALFSLSELGLLLLPRGSDVVSILGLCLVTRSWSGVLFLVLKLVKFAAVAL